MWNAVQLCCVKSVWCDARRGGAIMWPTYMVRSEMWRYVERNVKRDAMRDVA